MDKVETSVRLWIEATKTLRCSFERTMSGKDDPCSVLRCNISEAANEGMQEYQLFSDTYSAAHGEGDWGGRDSSTCVSASGVSKSR